MPELLVPSIHCDSCVDYITSVLQPLPGLRNLSINLTQRSLSFNADEASSASSSKSSSSSTVVEDVRKILHDAGYETQTSQNPLSRLYRRVINRSPSAPKDSHYEHCKSCREGSSMHTVTVGQSHPILHETTVSIGGMTCSACTSSVTSHLLSLDGVVSALVNLVLNSATVVHDINTISTTTLKNEIDDIGFEATIVSSQAQPNKDFEQTIFGVEGMTCSSCTQSIEAAIIGLPGIKSAQVNLMANSMTAVYDPSEISAKAIASAVGDTGFNASIWETKTLVSHSRTSKTDTRTLQIQVDGMFCGECPIKVNHYLSSLPILSYSPLSFSSPVATVTYTPSASLTIRDILNLPSPFSAKVYEPPSLFERSRSLQAKEARRLSLLFAFSTLFAIPTFIFGIIGMVALPRGHPFKTWCDVAVWGGATRAVIIIGALATVTQFAIGHVFYIRALAGFHSTKKAWRWSNLVHFGNMDLLVALSTSVAWCASVAMFILDVKRGGAAMSHMHMNMKHPQRETMTYFDSSVFLIFFILMGRVLEGRARVKTGDAIAMLGGLRPETALLVIPEDLPDSKEVEYGSDSSHSDFGHLQTRTISTDLLELNDLILLRPGSIPPADGTIVNGTTTTDESSLTGESLPVTKNIGDSIFTGTTNLTSPIIMRVDELGDETVLQKIVRAVSEAQGRKAPIEHLADRITSVFVPIVVWLSLAILTIWLSLSLSKAIPEDMLQGRTTTGDRVFFAFEFAIAVLVVACPCGIGLAAPTAQTVGAGMAARLGVLAKGGGEAFQLASQVDVVVFDKTGTLTTGVMEVVETKLAEHDARSWIWAAVRSLEEGSGHPLAKAIVTYCDNDQKHPVSEVAVKVTKIEEVAGRGMMGVVLVGKEEFDIVVGNEGLSGTSSDPTTESWKEQGYSIVVASIASRLPSGSCELSSSPISPLSRFTSILSIAISDTPRSDAISTITTLKAAGKHVYMLSGDNTTTATAVARRLGIDANCVKAGVLPHEKAEFISTLKEKKVRYRDWKKFGKEMERNSTVLFCGDGLNDAAALTAADVGVALAHGSQITLTTASFVLLSTSSSLTSLASLLILSRRVYNRQKLNFGWAMIYNIGMIPLAAGVFYAAPSRTRLPPAISALAMALSSGSVVLSSLALKWGL